MLRIKSSDGVMFTLANSSLQKSETLNSMIDLCETESSNEEEVVTLDKIESQYLKLIIVWLEDSILPKELDATELFHLIVCSDFLCIPELIQIICQRVTDMVAKNHNIKLVDTTKYEFIITKPKCSRISCDTIGFPEKFVQCPKCELARYCSKRCLVANTDHKQFCKRIQSHTKHVNNPDKIQYNIRLRMILAEAILDEAIIQKKEFLFEKALDYFMEIIKLNRTDNQGTRYTVPFLLLILNRDADCFNFLKWWLTDLFQSTDEQGDWHNLQNQDTLEDPCQWLNKDFDSSRIFSITENISFHVAYLCMKLRLTAKIKLFKSVEDCILSHAADTGLETLPNTIPEFIGLIFGNKINVKSEDFCSEKQDEIVENLLLLINKSNGTVLPALLNPTPLLSKDEPTAHSPGSPEEAYQAVLNSVDLIRSIPGSLDRIRRVVGHSTNYNTKFSEFAYY